MWICYSKSRKSFVYGKWTDVVKCADMASYEEYINSNPHPVLS